MMTRDRIFAARDPHGFRPLSMGRIVNPDGPDTVVFASETCAFDLLRAKYERDVRPGEVVMVTREGVTSVQYATGMRQASCIFEHVYFAQARQPNLRPLGAGQPGADGPAPGAGVRQWMPTWWCLFPTRDVTAALGYAAESGIPFNFGLIRNHYVGRTFIEPSQAIRDFGVKLKLNPVRSLLEGKSVILVDD